MKQELIFIPLPAAGHLTSSLQMAKLLVSRDENLSVRILVFKDGNNNANAFKSLYSETAGNDGIIFTELQQPTETMNSLKTTDPFIFLCKLMECSKPQVVDLVNGLVNEKSSRIAGFVFDMFTTGMMDVAEQFGIPAYLFYTSGAATLGLWLHLRNLVGDERRSIDFEREFDISTYENPIPAKLFPTPMFTEEGLEMCVDISSRIFQVKGILINTFLELESGALEALAGVHRSVYTVGPLINFEGSDHHHSDTLETETTMKWLDDQPRSSVVFLCFGSLGFFEPNQAKEIATALESSGCRFLWSLKTTHPSNPSLHLKLQDLLPEGFLQRTSDVGKVIGWAPQVEVLGHAAVGGFVTHCGWNSVLESVWFGVPMAAWPMYAEQQMNAFQIVKEIGIAVEIKLDYNVISRVIVGAGEIEKAIRKLMQDGGNERKKAMKELMKKARSAMSGDGSSSISLARLMEDLLHVH